VAVTVLEAPALSLTLVLSTPVHVIFGAPAQVTVNVTVGGDVLPSVLVTTKVVA